LKYRYLTVITSGVAAGLTALMFMWGYTQMDAISVAVWSSVVGMSTWWAVMACTEEKMEEWRAKGPQIFTLTEEDWYGRKSE
jgi:hypothetical protein